MDQKFRFSINGFNRSDVVRYLEYMNSKHTAKVNQLSMDNEMLRQELASLKSEVREDGSEELQTRLDSVTAERDALAERVRALEEEIARAAAKQEIVVCEQAVPAVGPSQELEAYRRAESMEREAREHARRIRLHMQQVISDVCSKVDAAAADCDSVASQASMRLGSLIDSVSEGRRLLQNAADELRSMDIE